MGHIAAERNPGPLPGLSNCRVDRIRAFGRHSPKPSLRHTPRIRRLPRAVRSGTRTVTREDEPVDIRCVRALAAVEREDDRSGNGSARTCRDRLTRHAPLRPMRPLTYGWSSGYALETSPSWKKRSWTFPKPVSLIWKVESWVQFRPSARVTLNVDQVVRR